MPRGVIRTADAATSTAGAVGGALVNGALGAIEGAVTGVAKRREARRQFVRSRSTHHRHDGAISFGGVADSRGDRGRALLDYKLGHRGDQPGTKDAPQSPLANPTRQAPRNPAPAKPASRGARP